MFCQSCGAPEQSPDTYCKKCGTYLRDVSFRGWLLGGNNPGKAASAIVISSVFIAILCVCISLLIVKALRSGDLAYLKYAFGFERLGAAVEYEDVPPGIQGDASRLAEVHPDRKEDCIRRGLIA
jgi:hypothetical protein